MALQMFQAGECSGTSLALIGLGAHVSWEPWEVHWRRRWRFGDKRIDLSIHARVLNYSSLGVWFLQFPELGDHNGVIETRQCFRDYIQFK